MGDLVQWEHHQIEVGSGARTQLSTVSKQLQHLQRLACLYITRAKRTAPTAALEIIIGIPPLAVYIKQEA